MTSSDAPSPVWKDPPEPVGTRRPHLAIAGRLIAAALLILGLKLRLINLQNDLPYQTSLNARGAAVWRAVLQTGDAALLTDKSSAAVRGEDLALLARLLTGEAPLRPALLPEATRPADERPDIRWGERGWLSALTRQLLGWNAGLILAGVVGWVAIAVLERFPDK